MRLRTLALVCVLPVLTMAATPAVAWWQFVALGDDGSRKVYTRFATEERCKAALKEVEAKLKKRFPDRFPLVGSCEEYR